MARAKLFAALAVLVFSSSIGAGVTASAASSNAVSLSPFLQNITITPNDLGQSFKLLLTNRSSNVQELDLTVKDFGSLNDTGGVLVIDTPNDYSQHYGLTSWLRLEADTVVLQPGDSREVLVTVDNRPDLVPGGHYGAVVASVRNLDEQPGNRVAINQQLLSLVLVDKQGGDRYDLKLRSLEQNGNWLHLPSNVKLHFQNPGNVHATPRGRVLLKNPAGQTIAQGIINTESAYILPASFRDLYVKLTPIGQRLPLPGIYHVEVEYRYDGLDKLAHKSYAVRFINLKLYIAIIGLILIAIWLFQRVKKARKNVAKTD